MSPNRLGWKLCVHAMLASILVLLYMLNMWGETGLQIVLDLEQHRSYLDGLLSRAGMLAVAHHVGLRPLQDDGAVPDDLSEALAICIMLYSRRRMGCCRTDDV